MQTSKLKNIPYVLPWDDAPIDLSFVFESEKPAGKHGFIEAKDGRLVFEDGTEARFWGTNFNSAANFPPHSYSEVVAKRLKDIFMTRMIGRPRKLFGILPIIAVYRNHRNDPRCRV